MLLQPRFSGLLVETRYNAAKPDSKNQTTTATLVGSRFPGIPQDAVVVRKESKEAATGADVVEVFRFQDMQIGEATRMLDEEQILRTPIDPKDEPKAAHAFQALEILRGLMPDLLASVFNLVPPGEADTHVTRTLDGNSEQVDLSDLSIVDIESGLRSYIDVFTRNELDMDIEEVTLSTQKPGDTEQEQTWLTHYRPNRKTVHASIGGENYTGTALILNVEHPVSKGITDIPV